MRKHHMLLEVTLNVILLSLALCLTLLLIFNAIETHLDNQTQSFLQAEMMNISENVLAGTQTLEMMKSYNALGEESSVNPRYQIELSVLEEGYLIQLIKEDQQLYEWTLIP
jgi:hypothetical protein